MSEYQQHTPQRSEGRARGNGHASTDQLQAELERTRHEMDETLTAIEERLSVSRITDQLVDYARHSLAADYGRNLSETVRNNPVPVTLLGLSVAWLMMGSSPEAQARTAATRSKASRMMEQAKSAVRGARRRTASGVGRARHAAGSVSGAVRHSAHSARDRTGHAAEQASHLAGSARYRASEASSGINSALHEHPIVFGLMGMAIGAGIAAAFPATRQENRLMGEARDRSLGKAKEAGREQAHKVSEAARSASHAASEAMREATAQGKSAPDTASQAAAAASEAATERMKSEESESAERRLP